MVINMLIETKCLTPDHETDLLKEIQNSQSDIEVWAYGLEFFDCMDTTAFEIAIFQSGCWYEIYQRLVILDDEEYARLFIQKHFPESTAEFPFPPHERIYRSAERKQEMSWTKIATVSHPFSICVYQDSLCTCCEKKDGEIILRNKLADIAFGFESASSNLLFQLTNNPYLLRVCHSDEDMEAMDELWEYHMTDEEEAEYYRATGSEEYFSCQRVSAFSRTKTKLVDRV